MIDGDGGCKADLTLDVAGFPCPLPVLRAKKALNGLAPGAVLEVLASDPASPEDFEAFCRATGHRLCAFSSEAGLFRFFIEKRGASSPPGGSSLRQTGV